ncbi:TM2 domain-containing membrane protein YozV [Halopseudomonas aestusnigri]|uniref:Pilin n=2 Tax=Halopseudomonas aestusnigri TaxID=857252 RepID=A0AAQ1G6J3_9GAMM|nr:NINE protein [Halopseudomonas aestusnigri]OWL89338.1 hypothetical protein B7O88_08675 [Halopseudomonas aestusnigri]SEG10217.1 TM2 domain-containing membrane protein YozV [Halopseudomonas aestusnigri]
MAKYCAECSTELVGEAPQCRSCGAVRGDAVYTSRVAAAALAFFTGAFGMHRFYLGQWWGIFYLLLCWTGIPSLVAFVEGIVILSTSQKAWNDNYNKGLSLGIEKGGVVIVVPLIFMAFLGIGMLAAIALPAYQDYTRRSQILESHQLAEQLKPLVEDYLQQHQEWPERYSQLAAGDIVIPEMVDSVEINTGAIIVWPASSVGVYGYMMYSPLRYGEGVKWRCTESTVEAKYLPGSCR